MSSSKILNAKDPKNIEQAVAVLRQGGVVAFPTETVYGLGADALSHKAVCRIFEAKQRPSFDPLIVHVASVQEACGLWQEVPDIARLLMKKFWPGPLTLVLPKSGTIPDVVTSGLPTVAVRMPMNEEALFLIRALGRPIAAPSANLFGHTSPTTAEHVRDDLGDKVDLVLDGGDSVVGVESTVVKIEGDHILLLRPGGVSVEELEKSVSVRKIKKSGSGIESPGQTETHYAPWTPFYLLARPWDQCPREEKKQLTARAGLLAFQTPKDASLFESVQVLSDRGDLTESASNLFQAMRKLDKMHLDILLAEPVPETGIGLAIMDRLRKASGGRSLC